MRSVLPMAPDRGPTRALDSLHAVTCPSRGALVWRGEKTSPPPPFDRRVGSAAGAAGLRHAAGQGARPGITLGTASRQRAARPRGTEHRAPMAAAVVQGHAGADRAAQRRRQRGRAARVCF